MPLKGYDFKAAKKSLRWALFIILLLSILTFIGLSGVLIKIWQMIWAPQNAVPPDTNLFGIIIHVSLTFSMLALTIYNIKIDIKLFKSYKEKKLEYKHMLAKEKGKEMDYGFYIKEIEFDIKSDKETKVCIEFTKFANIDTNMAIFLKYPSNFKKGCSIPLRPTECDINVTENTPKPIELKLNNTLKYMERKKVLRDVMEFLNEIVMEIITNNPLEYTTNRKEYLWRFEKKEGFYFVVAHFSKEE